MDDSRTEKGVSESKIPVEIVRTKPREFHNEFSRRWAEKKLKDFHNWDQHIAAVRVAGWTLIDAVDKDDPTSDPTNILRDVKAWGVDLEQFKEAFTWAAEGHDLGNILDDIEIVDGEVRPIYLDIYRAGKVTGKAGVAEDRAMAITDKLIDAADMPLEKKEWLKPLVLALIDETRVKKYSDKDRQRAFAVFMRIVDQAGNRAFVVDWQGQVDGLVDEMAVENPDQVINRAFFANFVYRVLPSLIEDKQRRKDLYRIWGKEYPRVYPGFLEDSIPVVRVQNTMEELFWKAELEVEPS